MRYSPVVEAPFPVDEVERIRSLHAYRVLDTKAEERFDRITRLATEIFGTPIALVSLVDEKRQWFKSRVGIDAAETPREWAFCAHAILDDQPLVVEDTLNDPRFATNPLVTGGPEIRFYGGAPLITPNLQRIGTLCVIDRQPRVLDDRQLRMLQDFASIVVDELELGLTARHLDMRLRERELAEDVAGFGHWRFDPATGEMFCSAAALAIVGLPPGSAPVPLERILERFPEGFRETVRTGLHSIDEAGFRISVRTQALGRCVDVIAERRPDGEGRVVVVGVFQDTSERESMRRRIQQSEKMATVGTLAAGVAHEINNPLSYIKANADVLAEELTFLSGASPSARLGELEELVDDIRDGARRIHRIVQGLKTFSRSSETQNELVELPRMLEISSRLCMNEVRHKATLVYEFGDAIPLVWADESQLVQVGVNLIVNAAHATPNGVPSDQEIIVRCGCAGETAFFEVEDRGVGMTPDVIGRVFDPFYTTKAQGVGTGLGLSISHGIVTALSGKITIHSSPGEGTRVRVELPRAYADPAPVTKQRVPQAAVGVPARILLVDDEPAVGRALGRILRPHAVVLETDPLRALERLRGGEPVDVVVCDVMMPGMSGTDFHAMVVRLRPELRERIIFVTGGVFTPEATAFLKQIKARVLTKPVDAGDLRSAVADVTANGRVASISDRQ